MNWNQYYLGYDAYMRGCVLDEYKSAAWKNGWHAAANLAGYYS